MIGVVSSTIMFGLLSSALFYIATKTNEDDADADWWDGDYVEGGCNCERQTAETQTLGGPLTETQMQTLEMQKQTAEMQTENVILNVNECDEARINSEKIKVKNLRIGW